jgi:hypothetical protein
MVLSYFNKPRKHGKARIFVIGSKLIGILAALQKKLKSFRRYNKIKKLLEVGFNMFAKNTKFCPKENVNKRDRNSK